MLSHGNRSYGEGVSPEQFNTIHASTDARRMSDPRHEMLPKGKQSPDSCRSLSRMVKAAPPRECDTCRAWVPRHLMHFHREWHASLEGRGKRLFNDEINGGRDLDFQQIVQMIAALRSVPSVEARPEFVQELRTRLVTEVEAAGLVQANDDV
jgi:hypothetical protein